MIYFVGISRAYFNAKVDESDPVYVELPPEIDAHQGVVPRSSGTRTGLAGPLTVGSPSRVDRSLT